MEPISDYHESRLENEVEWPYDTLFGLIVQTVFFGRVYFTLGASFCSTRVRRTGQALFRRLELV